MKELHVVVDMQFGSCGKGLLSGYLARELNPDTIVSAWAPNAGHTYINAAGEKFVNIALPSGIFESKQLKQVLIGPGSTINPEIFMDEILRYAGYLHGVEIMIHPFAAVVTQAHRDAEELASSGAANIGSTRKGVGQAMIQKIERNPANLNVACIALLNTPLAGLVVSIEEYNDAVDEAYIVLLEGAQGFSLSINQGFYPYTTSRDCTVHQLLSDCGLPHNRNTIMTVYGVCRTYPIRVNDRGASSGPGYDDQEEVSWEDLGIKPELTTVTQLPRRIFSFSAEQVQQAIRMNGIDYVFLNFANYAQDPDILLDIVQQIEYAGVKVKWLGYGPAVNDIIDFTQQEE